jgi:catechol 2,3-dioxygenase-like lactoylglutathione lyase family enzyme
MDQPPLGRPHFHRTVSDMKASIDFYVGQLGLFYDHGLRDVAWLTAPNFLLTLTPGTPQSDGTSYCGFALDSAAALEARYAQLHAGRQRLSGPPDVTGGNAYFFLYDPDDYPIIFSWTSLDYPEKA